MSASSTPTNERRWSRPQLKRDGPFRNAGGLYRTTEGARPGVGGLPLTTTEEAVVAAVRLAYNVAATQVERSTRLAQRLREAGDRAVGGRSDRKALDATEQLVFRTMMSALTWVEGAAAENDSPLQRLIVAQYRVLGQLLGVAPRDRTRRAAPGEAPLSTGTDYAPSARVQFVFEGGAIRPVRACRFEVASGASINVPIEFYSAANIANDPIKGYLEVDAEGRGTLRLTIDRLATTGLWKGAICDAGGVQLGMIEIEI